MIYLSFSPDPSSPPRPGVLLGDRVLALPFNTLIEFISAGPPAWRLAQSLTEQDAPNEPGLDGKQAIWPLQEVVLRAPLTGPPSLRDFYAFESHVVTAHDNRGKPVPPEWYQFPAFYFSNPNAIFGPEERVPRPAASQALDYELEVAAIIGTPGRDIAPERALEHIFGFTIMNDWSARDLQRQETKVGLGPAKGKDFATSLGPWIVSPGRLADRGTGRPGVYDLTMVARVNGVERSRGNWAEIHFSFGELIARASSDVDLLAGEVLGSGTVGTGSLLEVTRGQGPWLMAGDKVELEIERIGILRNSVAR
jgi:fumarylacetoacetate (FAA) hydrolase